MTFLSSELAATICFGIAVIHTFATNLFAKWAKRFPQGSLTENILHYLAEVEVVFGLWAFVFIAYLSASQDLDFAVKYLEGISFSEPAFVFVIMAMAATKPVMSLCENIVFMAADIAPKNLQSSVYFLLSIIAAPLLGGFITEPAAMVVSALLLRNMIFTGSRSNFLRYTTLGALFVNVSIGGTLTHFAAPPVVMVAQKWGWNFNFMFTNFGWKCALAALINGLIIYFINFKELTSTKLPRKSTTLKIPFWMFLSHAIFMVLVVKYHSSMAFFIPLFLLFIGWTDVTKEYQDPLKLRESLLVGFFLGGLVVLGQSQRWWIEPVITSLSPASLFLGATLLTAITDNAALTYLGSLAANLSEISKYVLVAGAVAGGGLTIIANAPNPIAVGLLKTGFNNDSINPLRLLAAAILPTIIACLCLWYL